MPFVQAFRKKFFYNEFGSMGPPVYLLHGLTAKNQDWGAVPDILAKTGFHVFAFDMRGHGQSHGSTHVLSSGRAGSPQASSETIGYAPEDHANDIEVCAQLLGHSRVHVVGHSTGGRNALVFAASYPDRAWSLTIVDQTLKADPDSWKKYAERYSEYPTPFADEAALEKFLKKKFPDDKRRYIYYKGQFGKDEKGQWDWNFSVKAAAETQRLGREKDFYDMLPKVKCPILFIQGGNSDYVPPEEVEKIKGLMPGGQFAVVEKAEHAVFRDNTEGFLRVLVPYLFKQSQGHLFVPDDDPPSEG